MPDDVTDIQNFYNDNRDAEDTRLLSHQIEYDLSWRHLSHQLPPHGDILEVGAATGRYTIGLATRGYRVTAVDLSPIQIEKCRERIARAGFADRVRCLTGDARDLDDLAVEAYDAVLMMGPLYHLVLEADRLAAMNGAVRCLRPGGMLFSAWLSRFGVLGYLIRNVPQWIERRDSVRSHVDRGADAGPPRKGEFRGYYALAAEIAPLHESLGLESLALAGLEPGLSADDESYNRLDGERRSLWLDLLYEASLEESIVAASQHLLYVGRKPLR